MLVCPCERTSVRMTLMPEENAMNMFSKHLYCAAALGAMLLASTASGQVLTFFGSVDFMDGNYRSLVNPGDPVTVTIDLTPPLTDPPFYYPGPTDAVYGYRKISVAVGGLGVVTEPNDSTFVQLSLNNNGDYGLSALPNITGADDQLSLNMLSKQPILSSTDYFPAGIDMSNFYQSSGFLVGYHDIGAFNGGISFSITSYSGFGGVAPIPESSTCAFVLASAALGLAVIGRHWRRQEA